MALGRELLNEQIVSNKNAELYEESVNCHRFMANWFEVKGIIEFAEHVGVKRNFGSMVCQMWILYVKRPSNELVE